MMALSWQLMTTGAFVGGKLAVPQAEIWRTDPVTLWDVVVDRRAMSARLGEYPSLERVWALSLLGRDGQAVAEGRVLLAGSADRFRPLLVLAHACQRSHRWHEAALLQEEALRLASSPAREALSVTRSVCAFLTKPFTGTRQLNWNGLMTCTGQRAGNASPGSACGRLNGHGKSWPCPRYATTRLSEASAARLGA